MTVSAIPVSLGDVIQNRYRLAAELGRGGMGAVYRARDMLLGREVAIKVLSGPEMGTLIGRERLLAEAQAAARLNHPNIVTIYDAGEANNVPFIVMELVAGQNLRAWQPPSLADALLKMRQVCAALQHAHGCGIIHRDLKPENVLVTPAGVIKLMDFGLARASDTPNLTREGSIVGTFNYLAPELFMGQDASVQSDLYSLGVMLYELTTGQPPFEGSDLLGLLSQHLHASVVPPATHNPAIPPRLESLTLRLLSKRPEERPTSAGEVADRIEQLLSSESEDGDVELLTPLDRMVRGRMVARERELGEANATWKRTIAGEPGVLLVSGEPGIGKTRLVRELAARAELRRGRVLWGECYAEGGAPYAALASALQTALAGLPAPPPPELLADLVTLAPTLRNSYPNLPPNPPLDPQAEQQRLFESVVQVLTSVSHTAPILLIVDDAHWADSGTLALLRHLARRSARLRLRMLIVLTYRESELNAARGLNEMLLDLNRERLSERIKLGRLSQAATHEMLSVLFAEPVTPEFSNLIYAETEGNPFFIEEICKALIDSGQIWRENGRWQRAETAQLEVPQSVHLAIQSRLDKLPPETQDVLRLAAFIGREFDFATLHAASELNEDRLADLLEGAERAQLISEVLAGGPGPRRAGEPIFGFAHALIPATLRESTGSLRRQRLHRRVAAAIEKLNPHRLDELATLLGEHLAEAGEGERAVVYLLRAGDHARRLYAYPEAIRSYEQALAFLQDAADHPRAARTLMRLGLLYHAIFDFKRSRRAYAEAFTLWQRGAENVTSGAAAASPPASRPLRLVWPQPLSLDSGLCSELVSSPLIDQLFSGLVQLTADLDVAPDMAESWEVLDEGCKYRFHLRPDARWSDGQPVTAGDFEYAWKRVLDPSLNSRNAVMLYDIRGARQFNLGQDPDPARVGVRAVARLTLEVELEEPAGYFLHLLTHTHAMPYPRHMAGRQQTEPAGDCLGPGSLVSNGPFTLECWDKERIVLHRNPRYPGLPNGNLQAVELLLSERYNHLAERLAAYEAGELDVCRLSGSPQEVGRARQRHAGEYVTLEAASTHFIVFNIKLPPFDNPHLRRAFVHAIDRETMSEVFLHGYVAPALGGLLPPGFPSCSPHLGLPFDPEAARAELAAAGFPGGQGLPELEGWRPEGGFTAEMMDYLSQQWQRTLGVTIRWKSLDFQQFTLRIGAGEIPPLYWKGWHADYPDPDNFLLAGLLSETPWRDEPYLTLVEAARRTTDQAERTRLYHQAEHRLVQEAPLVPLYHARSHMLVHPCVSKYPLSPIKTLDLKNVVLEA